jgi:phosphopentomutase
LGSKYYENKTAKFVEAEAKDTSNIKDVTAQAVSSLKNKEVANKKANVIKVDKVNKITNKKVVEEKVANKEVKSLIDFKGGLRRETDEKLPSA